MVYKNVHVKKNSCIYIPFLSAISLLLRKAAEPEKEVVNAGSVTNRSLQHCRPVLDQELGSTISCILTH